MLWLINTSNEPAQIFAGLIKGGKPHQLTQTQGNHLVTSNPLHPSEPATSSSDASPIPIDHYPVDELIRKDIG